MKRSAVALACRMVTMAAVLTVTLACFASPQPDPQESAQAGSQASVLGSIQSLDGNKLAIKNNAGQVVDVTMAGDARVVRIEPGQKNLQSATKIPLSSLAVGDRVLARGVSSNGGKQLTASLLVAIKKADILENQARQREEWQEHGVSGLVKSVDAAAGTVTILRAGHGPLAIHTSPNTVLKRYAPDSVEYDQAKPAPLASIRPGDELRARGAPSSAAAGGTFDAVEIVSGTFRNIAGPIEAVDVPGSTMTVNDLASKHPVKVRINSSTEIKRLDPTVAKEIAAVLRKPGGKRGGAHERPASVAAHGALNPQRILAEAPSAALSSFQKGQDVMLVATEAQAGADSTAITIVGGVESMLQASASGSQAMLSSAWNLSGSPGGGATSGGQTE